ncbi:unnamed protein product [Pseudo-nitzschia multistriata]|uniref:NADP-dependent oxidoreductase domain-containing protein n=1 Tax=Pseudo-nitzschia multistriata TaxID=183589 RepID=A0A448Z5B2_9STRA|nr:unnamed protein product [Pseudo-nitzschia multistriata]
MPPPNDSHIGTELPARKKAKTDTDAGSKVRQQSSLLNFFSSSPAKAAPKPKTVSVRDASKPPKPIPDAAPPSTKNAGGESATEATETSRPSTSGPKAPANHRGSDSVEAIVPKQVPASAATWDSLHDKFVLVRRPRLRSRASGADPSTPRTRVAAFDLDGTLLNWASETPGFWPSQLHHYELWNSTVVDRMRQLYDRENHLLIIVTNQGGIQGAHTGKKATLLKSLIDWLESLVERPLVVVSSTKSLKKYKERSFHKPTPKLWTKVLVPYFGKKSARFDRSASFFVGDSADEDDAQGGVDKKFASSVGLGAFYTPEEYFGASHRDLREKRAQLGGRDEGVVPETPASALEARKALLGGYLNPIEGNEQREQNKKPILLILTGIQGSGKSTFCRRVLFGRNMDSNDESGDEKNGWVWLSQDTINNGKPGKREKVEEQAREALRKGFSVLLDRMHLDAEERGTMINNVVLGHEDLKSRVRIHSVVLNPSRDVVARRVKNRTNHPGKVEGDAGVRIALGSMGRLAMPTYTEASEEGKGPFELISVASSEHATVQLALRYHYTAGGTGESKSRFSGFQSAERVPLPISSPNSNIPSIPSLSLGTMNMGRRTCTETVQLMLASGFRSIDTAPTYKNEDKVGEALRGSGLSDDVFVIAKVPKRATDAEQVREEFEKTLRELDRGSVDLLLLHWPSDVIAQNTLGEVWGCMEGFVRDKRCKALGVCNFNEGALLKLLRCCTIPPVLNQVERHPLLPQFSLLEVCARHNVLVQAHTPLGGAKNIGELLSHATVERVAKETGLAPAQVLVRWNLQQGVLVVARCSQEGHARELLACTTNEQHQTIPELTPAQMQALDGLTNDKKKTKRFVAPPFMFGSKAVYCWSGQKPSW